MYIDSAYKTKNTNYPSHDVDPADKQKDWHLRFAEAIYSNYLLDRCSSKYSDVAQMQINRSYGAGNQSAEQYKDILIGKKDQEDGKRKGWANVDFNKIISVAPKFRRIMIGIFMGQDHEIQCNAIDESAGAERERVKWSAWVKKTQKDVSDIINGITNTQVVPDEYEPASLEELDLYSTMGGFKLGLETAMEGALQYTDYVSEWSVIKDKLFGDFVDLGKAALKDYVDVPTQKVKKRHVDIPDFVYTLDQDGKISKAAEYRLYSIESIREETGLTEEEVGKLAYDWRSMFGNASSINGFYDYDEKTASYKYDDFVVPVLECEFASNDTKYKTDRKVLNGDVIAFDEPWRQTAKGKKIPPKVWNTNNKNTRKVPVKVFRKCKWIIGTKICWDYGLSHDIPRPTKDEALSSYHVFQLDGIPIMQACIPNFDQIQLANLRIQNGLALAPNSGIAYEYSSLQNMTINGKGLDPMDIVKMHRQTGSLFYKATVHRGGMSPPMAGRPMQELTGGIGNLLGECITIINMNLETIRDITGIGQALDASNPPPDTGLGVTEHVVAASNNSLRPIYNAYIHIKERCARSCALRIQIVARYNKGYWTYDKILGRGAWELLGQSADFSFAQMGIKIVALPNARDIADMEMELQKAVQVGQNGKPTITLSEMFAIKRIIRSGGSLKFAQILLAHREAKAREEDSRLQNENMQLNAKMSQDSEAMKASAKKEELLLSSQLKKDEKTHETNETLRVQDAIHGYKMEELELSNSQKRESVTA